MVYWARQTKYQIHMIGFFRKIRRKLANDNKPTKYFRYAIGEILLVVIGILIALQVNNLNEGAKQEEQYKTVLMQLYNSVNKDVWIANHTLAYTNNQIEIIDELLVNPETFQIEKLIHILYYLDAETYFGAVSETEYNFSLLRSRPEEDEQNILSKLISNYVSNLRFGRTESKEELTTYLQNAGIARPQMYFGLTAMRNFESVDTTYFTMSEKEKVKLLIKSNQSKLILRSLKSRKEMLLFKANQKKNSAKSILVAIYKYNTEAHIISESIGLLGTAINGYENVMGNAVPMILTDINKGIWEVDLKLNTGTVKFLSNDSWIDNWGKDLKQEGKLLYYGENIFVTKGEYHIVLNLSEDTYEFKMKIDN